MTKIRAGQISSGAATDGHVLTADGAGGTAWETPTGGGSQYRMYVYSITAGDFDFLRDGDGYPITALEDTE